MNWMTWDDCSLRKWLNDDFYNKSFDDHEKAEIIQTEVNNSNDLNNKDEGCADTDDYVFLLNLSELKQYYELEYFKDNFSADCGSEAFVVNATKYAIDNGVKCQVIEEIPDGASGDQIDYCQGVIEMTGSKWWLRTPCCSGSLTEFVTIHGLCGKIRNSMDKKETGVRPAMWVVIE